MTIGYQIGYDEHMGIEDELRDAIAADPRGPSGIADAAGMKLPNMSRFLNDRERGITVKTAEALAAVLGVKIKVEKPKRRRAR